MSDYDAYAELSVKYDTLLARVDVLEAALHRASQGLCNDGLCWCMYVRLVHPQDDPQDSVKLVDGHTDDCWAVRRAMRV